MATSGTAIFNPDIAEIIEEAWERIGYEGVTGYDVRTARRSLNLLGLEWANRKVNSAAVGSPVERSGTKVERRVRGGYGTV